MAVPARPANEADRQRALDAYEVLDTATETSFDEIVQLASEICGVPIAMITFIDRDRQWVKASSSGPFPDVPRNVTFCGHAILSQELTVIPDATRDIRFALNPFVTGQPGIRFYAGAPIRTAEGHALGMLCVADQRPRELEPHQHRALATLGRQVLVQLELRRRLLEESRAREVALVERDRFFELSIDPMCIVDLRGRFRRVNSAFAKIVGMTAAEVERETYLSLVHPDDVTATMAYGQRVLHAGDREPFENRYRTRTGEWRRVQWTSLAVAENRRIYGIARDVTDQHALEQQLHQAQKMEAVGQLAGGIAHDFNNLLSVINGFTLMARDALPPDSAVRDDLAEVLRAGEGATSLTRRLLAFARKSVSEPPRLVDLDALVGEVDKMLRRLIGENIDLVTQPTEGLWHVRADRAQLEQVMVNLIVNARDAMPRGGRIVIATANTTLDEAYARTHPGVKPGPYTRLSVRDTGTGMSLEVQGRIFEPFFTTKEVGKGTGLGLATVFGIVRGAGGHITVDSELGFGTTFEVYLPRAVGVPAAAVVSAPPQPRGKETIMLVEDDAGVRELARRGLSKLGYTVLTAGSAEDALAVLDGREVQLLLTDVIMPGMPGPELAAKVRDERPGLKVLFMSGHTRNALDASQLETGRVHFVEKPLTMQKLGSMVRELLDA